TRSEFPSHSRNDVMTQLPALKKKYLTYKSFAEATLDQVFTKEVLDKSYKLTATYSLSSYIENKGNGKFVVHALPAAAQLSPLNGIVIDDVNDDSHLDIVAVGNDYGTEVSTGRYDALNGLVLLGDGKNGFKSAQLNTTGFYVPGNAKGLVQLSGVGNERWWIASQNRDSVKVFKSAKPGQWISVKSTDKILKYTMPNGKQVRRELNWGSSFLSQSTRKVFVPSNAKDIVLK
ncbi:MAG: RNA-binding protein, partial [Chitinophagaceae bacterium]|nr:RNA-binding protein [Chitinophagaceae bacterium]